MIVCQLGGNDVRTQNVKIEYCVILLEVKTFLREQIIVVNHNMSLLSYICLKTIILFYIFKDRALLCVRPASVLKNPFRL